MIDLTLNSFLHPNILGLQPQFGTTITPDTQNKGGLSTAQVDNNMAMPFALMRPMLVDQSDVTSRVEYNANLAIIAEGVELTLGEGGYIGVEVEVNMVAAGRVLYTGLAGEATDNLLAQRKIKYTWNGSVWFCSSAPPIGSKYDQFPGLEEPAVVCGGQWTEVKTAGCFFRGVGGDALPYTGRVKVRVNDTAIVLDEMDDSSLQAERALADIAPAQLILLAGDEYRSVTAWDRDAHIITISEAFSDSNISDVYIGQAEGLPNITGFFDRIVTYSGGGGDGAFSKSKSSISGEYNRDTTTGSEIVKLSFDASRCNAVYGDNEHNTTTNMSMRIWVRSF